MPEITYNVDDETELIEIKDYPGLKIPADVVRKAMDKGQISAAENTKKKFFDAVKEMLPDDVNPSELSAREFGNLVKEAVQKQNQQQNGNGQQPQQQIDPDSLEKILEKERAKIESKYKAELEKERQEMKRATSVQSVKSKIRALLDGINEAALPYVDNMIDAAVEIEVGQDGKTLFRDKNEKDKYLYTADGKPFSEADIAKQIKEKNSFAFTQQRTGPAALQSGQAQQQAPTTPNGTGKKWSEMSTDEIAALI